MIWATTRGKTFYKKYLWGSLPLASIVILPVILYLIFNILMIRL